MIEYISESFFNFGKHIYQHNFSVSSSHSAQTHGSFAILHQ